MRLVRQGIFRFQNFLQFSWHAFIQSITGKQYISDTIHQLDRVGMGSLFIVVLTGLFTGMVFTLQTGVGLQRFGVSHSVGKIVSIGIIKELGPVLTALVFAGRVGAGIASQISSMVVTEQIDAIEAEGIDPVKRVVVSRLIACLIMLPLLTMIMDAVALIGGAIICTNYLGVSTTVYWSDTYGILEGSDLLMGIIKPIVFGVIVSLCGSFYGMTAERDARGVGHATTRAVVVSTILVILFDFVITKVMIVIFG